MTDVLDRTAAESQTVRPTLDETAVLPAVPGSIGPETLEGTPTGSRLSPRKLTAVVALWLMAMFLGPALVVYGLGPLLAAREQHRLTGTQTAAVDQAANESSGLPGVTTPKKAPEIGAPVGILEIGDIRLQQVMVEGVGSSQTRKGPGHVPGTAGPGQPGNSVVVARARGFGGPFGKLDALRSGNRILVTTTQGQSVYEVDSVDRVELRRPTTTEDAGAASGVSAAETAAEGTMIDDLYGPSPDDRLTLVTSAKASPANRTDATVVVAKLLGEPFAPTPQNGRSDSATGTGGDRGAMSSVMIAMLLYGAALGGCVLLYQRLRPRTAYMLSICPVLAATVIAGETLSRVFPAWT